MSATLANQIAVIDTLLPDYQVLEHSTMTTLTTHTAATLLVTGQPAFTNGRTEVAFVLDNVADWQTLAAGVRTGITRAGYRYIHHRPGGGGASPDGPPPALQTHTFSRLSTPS